jgi:hypothetical protein
MAASEKSVQTQQITGLKPSHFADLIRAAQLIFDPTGGVPVRHFQVVWEDLGIPDSVLENLQALGQKYRYASPHEEVEVVWEQLTPETRSWMIENKTQLWQIEELFPALDED